MSKFKSLLIIAQLLSGIAYAQDSVRVSSLDEVVVTANKYSKKQSESGKVISVITREQLERSSGKSLPELLNSISGTTIIGANNNIGTNQTPSIRGSSSGNVLILVDGIPVNDPGVVTNYFDLNFFSIEQIERVEVLKGGQSTLYGSDAVAGVINIITRKNTNKPFDATATIAAGSYNTFKANAGIMGQSAKSSYSLHYGYVYSDGFSSANDSTSKAQFDDDGFSQHSFSGSWRRALTDRFQLNLFGQAGYYKTELDASAFTDERDFSASNTNYLAGGGMSYQLPTGKIQLNYRYNHLRRAYLDDSTFKSSPFVNYSRSQYIGRTHFAELYGNWKWNAVELLAGIDFRRNATDQESHYQYSFGNISNLLSDTIAHMSQVSPFTSISVTTPGGFSLEAGARLNNHSEYGNNFTFNLNPSYLWKKKVKLFTNLYSAFKAPTLYQLFDQAAGNRSLKAERSIILESGAELYINNAIRIRALYFNRSTDDAIQYLIIDPATFAAQYRNSNNQRNYGVETELHIIKNNWEISANYTHTAGRLTSQFDETGMQLGKDTVFNNIYRIPANVINLTAGYKGLKNVFISSSLRISGERLEPVYASSPAILDGYYTVDVYGEYIVSRRVKIFSDLRNLTDQRYFDILGYNTRGINLYGGIKLTL